MRCSTLPIAVLGITASALPFSQRADTTSTGAHSPSARHKAVRYYAPCYAFAGERAAMRALQFIYAVFLSALLPIASLGDAGQARAQTGEELTALNAEVVRLREAGKYSEANPLAER